VGFLTDLKTLYHVAVKPIRGEDHAARMESFYAPQAEAYDDFRDRLLQGRRELFEAIEVPDGGVWVDLGGGTGANLERLGPRIDRLGKVTLADLCPSMLAVARRRIERHGWENVEVVEADATGFRPATGPADVVTFSYSLTMIPDWFAAVENAGTMLKPGGQIGAVDFYVAGKHPPEGFARHSRFTRVFWPLWFDSDNVFLSPDHVPFLHRHFEPVRFTEHRAKVPYLPLLRVPYYTFVGRKPLDA